jgi:hypothetical protein
VFAVHSASFGLITFGFIALLAGVFQINAIWNLARAGANPPWSRELT